MSDDFEPDTDTDDGDGGGIPFLRKLGVPPGMEALVMTFAIAGLAAAGFGAYWVGERIRVARGGLPDEAHVVTTWDRDAPIPLDVNGDGQEDFVGGYVGKGGVYVGAFDGHRGKILWRFGPIDIERPVSGGLPQFGLQGDLMLVNQKTKGTLVRVKDGEPAGQVDLPKARSVCAGETATSPLVIQTQLADQPFELDLTSRAVKPLVGRRPCERPMAHARSTDATSLSGSGKVQWVLRDGEDLVGMAHEPSRGATFHGYAAGKAEPSWSTPLSEPAGADALVPNNAWDLASGRLFVGHWLKSTRAQHVLALDAKTGKELWRVPIESPGSYIKSLSASSSRVYVVIGEFLVVLDATTGAVVLDKGLGSESP